ncbi:PAS domain S-box protein [Nocardioides sp. SYSU DS0663]|uniref:PAS domain S-box protein n=1 Tax=Nocardioides sp. SYSU DS0663 TaxID=3416445 RepID=UPI003F4C1278
MPSLPTIVLVDDAAEVRSLVRLQLRLAGLGEVVGEGADGRDAVVLAAQWSPDVMLLDVSMPDLDGLGALPQVLEASPRTRVVMYSGFTDPALAEEAVRRGAVSFVQKSTDLDALVGEVRRLLPGEQPAAAPDAVPGAEDHDPRAAARELEQHVERFAGVFDDAAIGMATLTLQGRLVRANSALARVLGRESADVVGNHYPEVVRSGGDADGRLTAALERATRGDDDVVEVEHRYRGSHLRTTFSPVRDQRGRPLYVFAQCQDVTRQRQAEDQLRQAERRFRLLVEAVEDYAIFMLDPTGHIASWNSGAQRSKGWTAEEIVGQHFRVFYPVEVARSGHPEHELMLALRDGSYHEEGWRVRRDGSRFWAHVTITAVHDEEGHHIGFAKVTRDNSERHRLLEEQERYARALAEANERLERANHQLAAAAEDQAQFLAVTAHELRTPVSVLSMSGRTLGEHWRELDESERDEILEGMETSSARLQRLLGDLLTTSRIQASTLDLRLEDVELAAALAPTVDELRRVHVGAELRLEVEAGTRVRADPGRLAQVIENLVANAVKHGAPPITIRALAVEHSVEIEVRDAGEGVPVELLPRLFERFTSRGAGGTGLGLHIVRELSRAQGGDAWYDPVRTAFVVRLPASGPP